MEIKIWEEFDDFNIPQYKAKVSVVYEDFEKVIVEDTLQDLIRQLETTIHDSFGL
jgi:hypothetical protein